MSHDLFRGAMPKGFAWEVLDVKKFDPETMTATVTWRHWGTLTGKWEPKNLEGDGRHIEMRGDLTAKAGFIFGH